MSVPEHAALPPHHPRARSPRARRELASRGGRLDPAVRSRLSDDQSPIPRMLAWSGLVLAPVILIAFEPDGLRHPWAHQLRSLVAVWLYVIGVVLTIHPVHRARGRARAPSGTGPARPRVAGRRARARPPGRDGALDRRRAGTRGSLSRHRGTRAGSRPARRPPRWCVRGGRPRLGARPSRGVSARSSRRSAPSAR
jgi:hypothetical protein